MKIRIFRTFLVFIACFALCITANAQKRYALLIGNNDYADVNFAKLTNSINDVELMRSKLSQLGFEPIVFKDLTTEETISQLTQFYRKIKGADVAVFYYSGHGINNYIVPAKTSINPAFISNQCVSIPGIMTEMRKACKLSFLFLDCCRSDEFGDKSPATFVGGLGPKGDEGVPTGQKTLYAAGSGGKAAQGDGNISIFTKSLANRIMENKEFRIIVNEIEEDVMQETGGKQHPAFEGNYTYNFTFNTKKIEAKKTIKFNLSPADAVIDFGDGVIYKNGSSITFNVGSSYSYTIKANGYDSESYRMTVGSDTPAIKEYRLKAKENTNKPDNSKNGTNAQFQKRRITVKANTKADVYWDGKHVGTTPVTIETTYGNHNYKLTAPKYYDYSSTYEVTDKSNEISRDLNKVPPISIDDFINEGQTWGISYVYGRYFPIGASLSYSFEDVPFMMSLDFGVNTDKDKYIIDKVEMKDIANFTRTRSEYDAEFKLSFTPYAYFKYFAVGCGVGFLYMSGEENTENAYGSGSNSSGGGISISTSSSVSISGIGGTSKFKFMLSPVVKGFIPLSEDKLYLSLSVGYDHAFGYTEKNGVNAGIGLQFQF